MSALETDATAPRSETLRLAARLNPKLHEPAVVMVCGVDRDDGVAALAVELGRSFALMRGGSVLAADCRFGSAAEPAFGAAAGRPGIRERLTGAQSLVEVETADSVPGLALIGTGSAHQAPSPLLGPDAVTLTDELRSRYRVAFLAVDPLFVSPTALRLARAVDGVILAIKAGEDRGDRIQTAISLLEQMEAKLLGGILVE